jgi:hypothetical protein
MARRAVVSAADVAAGSSGGRQRQVASGCVQVGGWAGRRRRAGTRHSQGIPTELTLGYWVIDQSW